MQKLSKQFAELVTRWKINNSKLDEFFVARIRLAFFYCITAIIILGGASLIVYSTVLSHLMQSIGESGLGPDISRVIIDNARDVLLNLLFTIDTIITFFVIVLGFLLTEKTLEPIKANMEKQKRFIADASHELRTPIAIVISGLEVNLSNKKLDFVGAKKTLEDTLEEMKEFSKLSNNLLDISKHDMPRQTKYESISINKLVESIVEKNKNLAQVKNIKIETKIESEANILGEKTELNRVFFNVFDNAIKYTGAGGIISVSDKIISGKYIITISDNGAGIPEDTLGKIFDPFFRGDTSRSTEGAGLGLTLSKKIIENHQGTISIKSQVNKGTDVIISLPVSSQ